MAADPLRPASSESETEISLPGTLFAPACIPADQYEAFVKLHREDDMKRGGYGCPSCSYLMHSSNNVRPTRNSTGNIKPERMHGTIRIRLSTPKGGWPFSGGRKKRLGRLWYQL